MDRIDELLLAWYEWSNDYMPRIGYAPRDSASRDFRSTRQWMTAAELSEEVDATLQAQIGHAVEPLVLALALRERLAVNTAVRNLKAGVQLWRNPRWPETQDFDYARAKQQLEPKLLLAGLLEKTT